MDFNFKKARNNKRREDKARSAHHGHPGQKSNNPVQKQQHSRSNQQSGGAVNTKTTEKPVLSAEIYPVFSQHVKHETEEKAPPAVTKSYSHRSVVSNWERYELPADIPEDGSERAQDFETLINSLSDVQGHLKLSHEQSWGSERSELQEVFFNINMHQLFVNLERVPFHVRQNVPTSLFTSEQLAVFEEDADEALKQSCVLKVISKEDSVKEREVQRLAETPVNELTVSADNNTLPNSIGAPSKSAGTSDTSTQEILREIPSSVSDSKAKSLQSENIPQTTPSTGKSLSGVPAANPTKDELDLDFLLSLDAAVPDKPILQQIDALRIGAATETNQAATEKLDDWLDDLLDD